VRHASGAQAARYCFLAVASKLLFTQTRLCACACTQLISSICNTLQIVIDRFGFTVYMILHYLKLILRHSAFYCWALLAPCSSLGGAINRCLPDILSKKDNFEDVGPHPYWLLAIFFLPFMLVALGAAVAALLLSQLARFFIWLLKVLLGVMLAVLAVVMLAFTWVFSKCWWKEKFTYAGRLRTDKPDADRPAGSVSPKELPRNKQSLPWKSCSSIWQWLKLAWVKVGDACKSCRKSCRESCSQAAFSLPAAERPLIAWVRKFQRMVRATDLIMYRYFIPPPSVLKLKWKERSDGASWEMVSLSMFAPSPLSPVYLTA
jgi:hypothetical protein